MKLFVLFGVLAITVYVSSASVPQLLYDDSIYELRPIEEENRGLGKMTTGDDSTELSPIRHRRVTCDVLSWQSKWFTVNNSACAIRCLAQRRKGGVCRDGICVCRK